jgi:hypothetical protein
MGRILGSAISLLICLLLSGPAPPPGEPVAERATAENECLLDLLPERTLLGVEIRDFARRWPEIREVPTIIGVVNEMLAGTGLDPDDLSRLAGDRAVLALVRAEDGLSAFLAAVLRPARLDEAERSLREAVGAGDFLAVRRERGSLWVASRDAASELEALAKGDGTRVTSVLPIEEIGRRLPAGGLVRGWLNAPEVARLLRAQVPGAHPLPFEMLGSLAAAELEAVRLIGFRRDLAPGGVITEAVVGYDLESLPPEVASVLTAPAETSVLPAPLPPDTVLAVSFRPEGKACVPWLRYAAVRDAWGPLRNLEFWLDEFEERTETSLDRDLFQTFGEQGWLFVLHDENENPGQTVMILETTEPSHAEQTLLAFRTWLGEQAVGRSLGFALPKVEDTVTGGTAIHGIGFWTPLGQAEGPAFAVRGSHLVIATGTDAVRTGLSILDTRRSWEPAPDDPDLPSGAQGALLVRGPAIARLVDALVSPGVHEAGGRFSAVATAVLGDLDRVSGGIWYEGDALRFRGRVRLVKSGSLGES